ncbi:hypothetical protein C1645_827673 [Glomus cerebriforme]|uniref:MULE transposase domain-containing protein n=1 Tax=Glomus cerebriforme TaxID=658196 RepID=A0A397SRH1_9GLOM|nr:hypothetical protein C1645_827673 [Glomus cerebriforme]
MDYPRNELELEEDIGKENTLVLSSKSVCLQNTYKRVDGSVNKNVFECRHAGKPKSYKGNNPSISCNTTTIHVECTCYINTCWPKADSNPHVTTFATAIFAPSYHSLLKLNFMLKILLQDLYQYYHDVIITDNTSGTNKYHIDLCFFVGVDNRNHTQVFAQALLSDETSTSDADTGLDAALKTFVKHAFPCASNYLMGTLNKIKESWGKEFICMYFTVEMTSTQCVEGINSIIKKAKGISYNGNIFYIKAQLDICLEYNSILIPMEEYEAFEEDDVAQETNILNIDDQVDFAQISLKSLIGKVMIHSQQAKFKQALMDINGELSLMHSLTILSTLREDLNDTTNDINMKIETRHLYGNLFGIGHKIAQMATEKRRFDILEILNQVLEELCDDTNEIINESNQVLNPHIVKSKGRSQNTRFKSSVETHKYSNKNGDSVFHSR